MRCEMYTRCLTRNTLVTVHEHVKRLDNTLRQKNKQYVQNNKKLSWKTRFQSNKQNLQNKYCS